MPFASWEALPWAILDQWRWDHEREAVLAEDAAKRAAAEERKAQEQRTIARMTYASFRRQKFFPDWGKIPSTPVADAARKLLKDAATKLEKLGPRATRKTKRAVLRDCIRAFNRLNEEHDHWIESIERDDICEHFDQLARIAGFADEPHLADEWRDW